MLHLAETVFVLWNFILLFAPPLQTALFKYCVILIVFEGFTQVFPSVAQVSSGGLTYAATFRTQTMNSWAERRVHD